MVKQINKTIRSADMLFFRNKVVLFQNCWLKHLIKLAFALVKVLKPAFARV
jgi:hypothetical protein